MTYIIDFDYTIFDTARFTRDLASRFGYTEQRFLAEVGSLFTAKGDNYSLIKHINILRANKAIDNGTEEAVEGLFLKCDDYIFDGVKEYLQHIRSLGGKTILLTAGDEQYQKRKIENTCVRTLFDSIDYVGKSSEKVGYVQRVPDDVCIINDNAQEMLLMKGSRNVVDQVLIEGPYSQNAEHDLAIYRADTFFRERLAKC